MFAIETELGRFEAETERKAKSMLRKAQKAHDRQAEIDSANRKQAQLIANSNAYHILQQFCVDQARYAHAWIVRPSSTMWNGIVRKCADHDNKWFVRLDDSLPVVESSFYGYEPIAVKLNTAGDVTAVWTRTVDGAETGKVYAMAFGAHGDQHAYAYLPDTLKPEFFEE